jgi:hypothetical protein
MLFSWIILTWKLTIHFSKPDPIEQLVAAPVQRPTQLDPSKKNMLAITIPPGWLTTISSVRTSYDDLVCD